MPYFTAPDGDNEPTLWETIPNKDSRALMRLCDLPVAARPLWPVFVEAVARR